MIIEINKDIEKYKETVVLGLTAKQLCYSLACVAAGTGLFLLLYPHIGMDMTVYIVVPVILPIGMNGFYDYNGLGFTEMMKRKIHYAYLNRPLRYGSTETDAIISEIQRERDEREAAEKKKEKGILPVFKPGGKGKAQTAPAKKDSKNVKKNGPESVKKKETGNTETENGKKGGKNKKKAAFTFLFFSLFVCAAFLGFLYCTGRLMPVINMIRNYVAGFS